MLVSLIARLRNEGEEDEDQDEDEEGRWRLEKNPYALKLFTVMYCI